MTYSVYDIKIDNGLYFTPGPTAGFVLGINGDGSTSWIKAQTEIPRFITQDTTIPTGNTITLYDMFILSPFTINSYNMTYSIANEIFYNNALLNIIETLYIDNTFTNNGVLVIGT